MNAIEIQNLTKYYGTSRGIEGVSLIVEEGDFFGFIGPNGAGKSTTIRTLLGLIAPTSGSARALGRDIRSERTAILADVGYLPSETMFYSGMRVRDVLRFSADLHRKDCRKEASILCERLDLDPSRKVDELSLGNRKKVGIVCAMQHQPKLFIMDEPTSGLDPLMQKEFYAILKEHNANGATVFLSSHILSEIQNYCRNAAVIRDGQILVTDSVERLSSTGARRVTIRGLHQIPAFPSGDFIRDWKETEHGISFLYSGSADLLLKVLSGYHIEDITIAEPDLQEVFLHYYS